MCDQYGINLDSTGYEWRWAEFFANSWVYYEGQDYVIYPYWWWECNVENSSSWETISLDEWGYVTARQFSVVHNGTVYPECKMIITSHGIIDHWGVLVPQGYNGNISLTISGVNFENGEQVKNDAESLTFYLSTGTSEVPATPVATPEEPAVTTPESPAPTPQGTTYVTKSGDSLSKIAQELYGDKTLWKNIYELNKNTIKDPNVIYSNMQLILP